MPLPFFLGLGAFVAGAAGVGGHLSAKETNEKAQKTAREAQNLYNEARHSLEIAQNNTEKSLLTLGYGKKNVLETSMNQFLKSYDKVKEVKFTESVGINEISKFTIDHQGAIEIRRMTDIYENSFKSGATGAATGAVIALAASGSLPVVTGTLATAGTAVMAGEVGVAAGLAGSALSFGAAMTPLAAVAAPVILFTGISASIKADENLEKANTMLSEAKAASAKMKVSETLCYAISERAEMFDKLLIDLNAMFAECSGLMAGVIRKKEGKIFKKKLSSADFTEDEIKLISVTRALAGAVKSVIDTPMLSNDGEISFESQNIYDTTASELSNFHLEVKKAKMNINYVKAIPAKPVKAAITKSKGVSMPEKTRNVLAFFIGVVLSVLFAKPIALALSDPTEKVLFVNSILANQMSLCFVFCASTTMMIGKSLSDFFNEICRIVNVTGLSILYIQFYRTVSDMDHYIIFSLIMIFILVFIMGVSNGKTWCGAEFIFWQSFAIGCLPCAFLVCIFMTNFVGISETFSLVVTSLVNLFFVSAAMSVDKLK